MGHTSQAAGSIRPFEVTNRTVLAIAVPMTLAYLTTPLLGLVDTMVVGQFGNAALIGGLATGALVLDVIFATFNFLRSGTTGLVAQSYGRGDEAEQQAIFWRAMAIALVSGIVIALLAPALALAGQRLIGADAAVNEAMETYIRIRLLAAPLSLINYAILGYVLGRGEGSLALLLQVLLNGVNIVLSVLLGLKLGWGVAGVAWGAVCGEMAAALLGLAIMLRRFAKMPRLARTQLFDRAAFGRMVSLNGDIIIRSFALLAAFALFARQGAQLGTVTLAANAVLMNFLMVASFFLDGFASAAEQLAGRAVGARYVVAFRRAVRLTAFWGFALAAILSLVTLLAGERLVAIITTAEDVRAVAAIYLPWAALSGLSGVLAFQMDGVFIGATWSRDMRNMMLASFVVYVATLFLLAPAFGNAGLWAALHIFLLCRGLALLSVLPGKVRATFP